MNFWLLENIYENGDVEKRSIFQKFILKLLLNKHYILAKFFIRFSSVTFTNQTIAVLLTNSNLFSGDKSLVLSLLRGRNPMPMVIENTMFFRNDKYEENFKTIQKYCHSLDIDINLIGFKKLLHLE